MPGAAPARWAYRPRGHDVSSHQGNVNWRAARNAGAAFVYVKATESTTYRNPYFRQQYNGARSVGLLHGAYHFALPNTSSGAAQAAHFLRNGGRPANDGWSLPPALDLESNPYHTKRACYGLSDAAMVGWISSFSAEVRRQTGRHPVLYTTTRWWRQCTGESRAFADRHPLWLASWSSTPGPLPAGWKAYTFWQHANRGKLPGDQNMYNGSMAALRRLTSR
nr:lysozyme [Streptomyces zagrosensis]